MSESVFWSRLLGFYLVIVGVANVLDREHLQAMTTALINTPSSMMMAGVFTLLLGLAIVVRHHIWKGWSLLVTVLGFWITFKGIMLLFFPSWIEQIHLFWNNSNMLVTAVPAFVLGLILLYLGYFHKGHW